MINLHHIITYSSLSDASNILVVLHQVMYGLGQSRYSPEMMWIWFIRFSSSATAGPDSSVRTCWIRERVCSRAG